MYDRRSSVISDIVRNISYKDPEYITSKFRHTRCKKVAQILEDDLIVVYDSVKEAKEFTGISDISVVCKGKNNRKTAGGYKWKYYEES